jgi:uncharacterized membrane protein YsdA (DUF1294 family)/cold shock CspA family protein
MLNMDSARSAELEHKVMANQQRGRIVTWKDDRGFGFIAPNSGGDDLFFHISDVVGRSLRPSEAMDVFFVATHDEQRRLRAVNVHLANEPLGPVAVALLAVCVFFVVLGLAAMRGLVPAWMLLFYLILSCITFLVYGNDKSRAISDRRRVPERRLHLLEFLGGWPGALVAQWYFWHKNRKPTFQAFYWIMVCLNLIVLTLVALSSLGLASMR